jgi:hypothetical protein
MVAVANDRLAAFAGLKHFSKGKRILWQYFRYMKNAHPHLSPVLSVSLLTSDVVPGVLKSERGEHKFILAFQQPSREFFDFFSDFEQRFQFNPDFYFFSEGRADQEGTYSQYLPSEQQHRKIHIVGTDDTLNINLSQVFD